MSYTYEMGLRSARCNGCSYAKLKHKLKDEFHELNPDKDGWITVYKLDAKPLPGQSQPLEIDGKPIQFQGSFMSIGHSDECYNWKPNVRSKS